MSAQPYAQAQKVADVTDAEIDARIRADGCLRTEENRKVIRAQILASRVTASAQAEPMPEFTRYEIHNGVLKQDGAGRLLFAHEVRTAWPQAVDWKAAFEQECAKFQAETLRTSRQAALLTKWFERNHDKGCRPDAILRGCDDCDLMRETQELLQAPINVTPIAQPPNQADDTDAEREELRQLRALINNPQTAEFLSAVKAEAAHQRQKWGEPHDRQKSAENWFWLVGYLSGKALRAAIIGDTFKAKHHTISSAAALCNWFEAIDRDKSGSGMGADNDIKPTFEGGREGKPS